MKKIILIIFCLFLINTTFGQWAGMGTGPGGVVRALCVHDGVLYAGGDFAGLVKRWDGSTWVTVGSLGTGKVNTLVSFNGSLYAGGGFTVSGKDNVAKLNGTTWVAVGDGLGVPTGSEVKVLYVYASALYAGGNFTQSGTAYCQKVARLKTTGTWEQVGGGAPTKCSQTVFAMTEYYGELYVGGTGSAPWINKIQPGGTQWVDLSTGGPSQGTGVYALCAMKHIPNATATSLFIGGDFTGLPSNVVCKLYNTSWGTAPGFTSGKVNCFIGSSNDDSAYVYAGGAFTGGTHPSTNIAKRTVKVDWDSAGSPSFNAAIYAFCYFQGYLVAGGEFSAPGNFVARYATTVGVDEVSGNVIVNNIYPNPVLKEALLKVQTQNKMKQPELRLMDASGNAVEGFTSLNTFNHYKNEVEFRIDREGLAAGVYYYMVLDEERSVATGKMIVE